MRVVCLIVFCAVLCLEFVCCRKLPSFITPCKRSDPQISDCVKREVEKLRPRLLNGVPELYLPSLNPLVVSQAGLNSGANFNASFKDIRVYHAEEFILEDLKLDIEDFSIDLTITFPRLRIMSVYQIDGKLLVLELKGSGPADGNFTQVHANIISNGERVTRKGRVFVNIKDHKLDLKLGKPVFQFDDIFGDNQELNVRTNQIINENIEDIIEELKPVINQVILEIIGGILNRVFQKFEFDELFPK